MSGRDAIQVVDRAIEVDHLVTVVEEVPVDSVPQGAAWTSALLQLAAQVDACTLSVTGSPAQLNGGVGTACQAPGITRSRYPSGSGVDSRTKKTASA